MTHGTTLGTAIVTMRIPLGYGRFTVVELDPEKPFDFAPLQKQSGARVAQQGAPLHWKSTSESGTGAPVRHSAPGASQEWRSHSHLRGISSPEPAPKKSSQDELRECREVMAEKASELAAMDSCLAPVRAEELDIRSAIVATHDKDHEVVVLNLGNRNRRSPLFARLDKISVEWGWLKNQRKTLHGEVRTLERQIDHIRRAVERDARKKARG